MRQLDLCHTKVGDLGLEHLKGLTKLERLELTGTAVTDAGLEHLKGLSQLRELHVDYTKVTDEGVKKLRPVLPACEIIWGEETLPDLTTP